MSETIILTGRMCGIATLREKIIAEMGQARRTHAGATVSALAAAIERELAEDRAARIKAAESRRFHTAMHFYWKRVRRELRHQGRSNPHYWLFHPIPYEDDDEWH